MDLFTTEFKRLKARNPQPNFKSVINLNGFDHQRESPSISSSGTPFEGICQLHLKAPYGKQILGITPCNEWQVFTFDHYQGFTVIKNPFVNGYQKYWVSRCLQDFPTNKKNVTNLSALGDLESFDLWHNFSSSKRTTLCKEDPLRKLRWTTLGYHYNWTTKEYNEEHMADFPPDVQCLTQYFADCLELGPFKAEAAIVNYYHSDSTLAGHTDHSELDHNAPLFSISFGQTAVFMLGGLTKSEKPMSLFLQSGDVCIMSGQCRLAYHAVPRILSNKDGMTNYSCFDFDSKDDSFKGINDCDENSDCHHERKMDPSPKSIYDSCEKEIDDGDAFAATTSNPHISFIDTLNKQISENIMNLDWNPFQVYLENSRINLNVRQVFPPDCECKDNHSGSPVGNKKFKPNSCED